MCNIMELSRHFVYLGGLVQFLSAWEDIRKLLGCGLLGGDHYPDSHYELGQQTAMLVSYLYITLKWLQILFKMSLWL